MKYRGCNVCPISAGCAQDECVVARYAKRAPLNSGKYLRVLVRDKFYCRTCGRVDGLEIHHIDKNRKNNKMNNLITLCRTCHRLIMHDKAVKM